MTKSLRHTDIRTLFKRFKTAIKRDQRLVDATSKDTFHRDYNDAMWRDWRVGSLRYIDDLLASVAGIPPVMLAELTRVAISYEPRTIQPILLELLAEAVGGCCSEEELATAASLFGCLIREVGQHPEGDRRHQDAREAILQWMTDVDPLRIAHDPECGYADLIGAGS